MHLHENSPFFLDERPSFFSQENNLIQSTITELICETLARSVYTLLVQLEKDFRETSNGRIKQSTELFCSEL